MLLQCVSDKIKTMVLLKRPMQVLRRNNVHHFTALLVASLIALNCLSLKFAFVILLYTGCLSKQNWRYSGEPYVVWSYMPWLGSVFAFGAYSSDFIRHNQTKYGSTFVVILIGKRNVFVTDHLKWKKVLADRTNLSFEDVAKEVMCNAFSITRPSIDHQWEVLHAKSVINDITGRTGVSEMTECARDALDAAMDQLEQTSGHNGSQQFDTPLFAAVNFPFFQVMMKTMIGDDFATRSYFDDFNTYDAMFPYLAGGVPPWVLFKGASALKRLATRFRLAGSYATPDAPSSPMMRTLRHLLGQTIPVHKQEHGAFASIMMWASFANTGPAALWLLYWIARAKGKGEDISELIREMRGATTEEYLDKQMPVLDAWIDETMRLSSSSMIMRRVLIEHYRIPGSSHTLRKNDAIAIFPPLLHHDPTAVGDHVKEFNHRRYLISHERREKAPLMPFGGGASMCPGRFFARRVIKIFVISILERFDIALVDSTAPVPKKNEARIGLGFYPPASGADATVRFTPVPNPLRT